MMSISEIENKKKATGAEKSTAIIITCTQLHLYLDLSASGGSQHSLFTL